MTSYRAVVPAFDVIADLSWLGWTADHLPLAGRSDWGSLGLVAVASALLLGVGVVSFVRRDIGITGTTRMPGLPRVLLGIGGPVRRSFSEVLPMSVAWGVGLGLYGLLMAAASRAFVDEMAKAPSLLAMAESMLPGMDWTTPVGFLELLFVDFGLVLVGLAAATLVWGRMGDESEGRFELLLTTPLTRVRWAVVNGIGAWLGVALITAIIAAALVIGVSAAGGEVAHAARRDARPRLLRGGAGRHRHRRRRPGRPDARRAGRHGLRHRDLPRRPPRARAVAAGLAPAARPHQPRRRSDARHLGPRRDGRLSGPGGRRACPRRVGVPAPRRARIAGDARA